MPRKIETLFLDPPAGRLEALLEEPEAGAPREAVLLCHPHPQQGGTMHNKVVYRIARGLRRTGAVVLRFNYRGVKLSQGAYVRGEGELEGTHDEYGPAADLQALVESLREPKKIVLVEARDHFFGDALERLEAEVMRL